MSNHQGKTKKIVPLYQIDIGKVSFRFWSHTKRRGSCIEWQGRCDKDGYGRFSIFHGTYVAHRIAYFLYYGVDPGDNLVLHRCDNSRCVNPRHLFLGDQKANVDDMDSKGRRGKTYQKGESSGKSVLSEADVLTIRKSDKSTAQLARDYLVSPACIDHARRNLTWKHLPYEARNNKR
ncbi:MAG: HNH endonuclease [Candidatus Paceibacterota bacterium]|jgi:hypothetical protein